MLIRSSPTLNHPGKSRGPRAYKIFKVLIIQMLYGLRLSRGWFVGEINYFRRMRVASLIFRTIFVFVSISSFVKTEALYDAKIGRAQNIEAMEALLREVQSKFFLEGKPIPPLIVQFFQNPISDLAQPYRLALDLNMAINTNLFPNTPISRKDGWIISPLPDNGFFKYKYIGRLSNGLHIVISAENQGGTFTLLTLSAFFISLDWALQSSGQPYNRLKMEIYFQTPLDFFEQASIDNNVVHIFHEHHKSSHRIESTGKLVNLN